MNLQDRENHIQELEGNVQEQSVQEEVHAQEAEVSTNVQETYEQVKTAAVQERSKPKKKRSFSSFLSGVTGAIIGSVATLYVAPVLGLGVAVPIVQSTSSAAIAQPDYSLPIQQTAATAGGMVSAIQSVKEAVVGVVNIQQATLNSRGSQGQTVQQEAGTGSGVIFKQAGDISYVVTNNHVVEGATKVEVVLDSGERIDAKVVGTDALTDLAVLEIDSKYVTVVASFGDSSKLQLGEQVAAIGNPLGLDLSSSVTQGIVSGVDRTVPVSTSQGEWDLNVIQTDAAINPGNSGGALINSSGQVIGINSLKIAEDGVEGLGFAIPSEDAAPIIEDLLQYGEVKRPYLGVGLQSLSDLSRYVVQGQLGLPENVTEGVVVTNVEASSPAARGGLQAKDVVTAINGTAVTTVGELRKYIYTEAAIGDEITMEVYRKGEKVNVSVKMMEKGQ